MGKIIIAPNRLFNIKFQNIDGQLKKTVFGRLIFISAERILYMHMHIDMQMDATEYNILTAKF